jgi:adenine phosphoribosyltransferase
MNYKSYIKDIPDFPVEGVLYRDIQPLLADPEAFEDVIHSMTDLINIDSVDYFVGIESRGFIFATAMAWICNKGFKMIRKAGKLPDVEKSLHRVEYDLEYGSAAIEMESGWGNVVIVDDVLATGGTIKAAEHLATSAGYQVVDSLCLLDIGLIKNHNIKCLISY